MAVVSLSGAWLDACCLGLRYPCGLDMELALQNLRTADELPGILLKSLHNVSDFALSTYSKIRGSLQLQ